MDKNYLNENAKSQVSPPATKRKPLSKAAKERRRIKKLQRQYPTGKFSQIGSDPEPSFPDLAPEANAYILNELRRTLRSGKTAYGKNMTKDVMAIFGRLPNNEPAELENWINWLCRNREELISGKYSPGKLNGAAQGNEGSSAGPDDGNSLPSALSDMYDPLPDLGNATKNLTLTDDAPTPIGANGSPGQDHDQMKKNLTEVEEVKPSEGDPMPTVVQDHGLETFCEAPGDIPNQVARHASGDLADQPHIKKVEAAVDGSVAKIPDKFDFYFKKQDAVKANRFFGSILFNDSLEKVLENALALASDKAAVDEVLTRGPKEREYLITAMRDLQVPLP
ncbi:MAG: hypothetical protein V7676_05500 [Parasphingorhabdus sp.]|uniref:hypothetical protein n=1 Tax=Parasphingorhabdus sp. TaxID=2709688 RepID=UPI00300140DE